VPRIEARGDAVPEGEAVLEVEVVGALLARTVAEGPPVAVAPQPVEGEAESEGLRLAPPEREKEAAFKKLEAARKELYASFNQTLTSSFCAESPKRRHPRSRRWREAEGFREQGRE
jgi:hypothetical protein